MSTDKPWETGLAAAKEHNKALAKENRHVGSYLRRHQPELFARILAELREKHKGGEE